MFFAKFLKKSILVVKKAMTVAFEVGIGHLRPEFLADALVIFVPFQPAGAVAAGALKTLFNSLHHFFVIVQPHSHTNTSFQDFSTLVVRVLIQLPSIYSIFPKSQ